MDLTAVFEGGKINRYTPSDGALSQNKGRRVDIAYELENGDMSSEQKLIDWTHIMIVLNFVLLRVIN